MIFFIILSLHNLWDFLNLIHDTKSNPTVLRTVLILVHKIRRSWGHLITLTSRRCRVQLLTDPWAVNLVTTPIANRIVLLLQISTPVPQLNFGGQLLSSLVPALLENLNQGRPELIISVESQFGCPLIGLIQLPEWSNLQLSVRLMAFTHSAGKGADVVVVVGSEDVVGVVVPSFSFLQLMNSCTRCS